MRNLTVAIGVLAPLGVIGAVHGAYQVTYTVAENTPTTDWDKVTVFVNRTDGPPVDFVAGAAFISNGGTTATRFMNQNFSDEDSDFYTTNGIDFWNGDPLRGFVGISEPIELRGISVGNSGPAFPGGYIGDLPLPASIADWDTHFLGDFNQHAPFSSYPFRWIGGGVIANNSSVLSAAQITFPSVVQAHPMAFAQLVVHKDRIAEISPGVSQTTYSITFIDPALGTNVDLIGYIIAPEPPMTSMIALAVTGLLRRRHRRRSDSVAHNANRQAQMTSTVVGARADILTSSAHAPRPESPARSGA